MINANINGSDFTIDADAKNNKLTAVSPAELFLNTDLSGYPIGDVFKVPYMEITEGSPAINTGTNSYIINTIANPAPADPVEYVLQEDILGHEIQEELRDIGAYEANYKSSLKLVVPSTLTIINKQDGIVVTQLNQEDKVMVYDSRGLLLYTGSPNEASEVVVSLNKNTGIYIISVNGKAQKHLFK